MADEDLRKGLRILYSGGMCSLSDEEFQKLVDSVYAENIRRQPLFDEETYWELNAECFTKTCECALPGGSHHLDTKGPYVKCEKCNDESVVLKKGKERDEAFSLMWDRIRKEVPYYIGRGGGGEELFKFFFDLVNRLGGNIIHEPGSEYWSDWSLLAGLPKFLPKAEKKNP